MSQFYSRSINHSINRVNILLLGTLILLIIITAWSTTNAVAQVTIGRWQSIDSTLHLLYYDSCASKAVVTKSAIVEFEDFLALIELPVVYDGGGARKMKEHVEDAAVVMKAIQERFGSKQLKFVLFSHWHPHSMSAITPFIERGIQVVCTKQNFDRVVAHCDSALIQRYRQNICFVQDSLTIRDSRVSITAFRLDKTHYPFLSSDDYLFFDLPRSNTLFCSCMYQRFGSMKVRSRELISGRTEDLQQFLAEHSISPKNLLSFMVFDDNVQGCISADTMLKVMREGTSTRGIIDDLLALNPHTIRLHVDSLRDELLRGRVPLSYINIAIYRHVSKARIQRALALAQLQAFANPSDPNSWDTYGEMLYILGQKDAAAYYERASRRIDKDFTQAGEKVWKPNLERLQTEWREAGLEMDSD